jgi:hypothetical protein
LYQGIVLAGLKFPTQELICCQDIIRSEGCFFRSYHNCMQIDDTGLFFCLRYSNFNEALAMLLIGKSSIHLNLQL